ncbi:EF-hand domain-containing protein [Kitasatospora sp. NPDC052896]|uniref:EF-hand domain-containing protein n=1 Tax=Kitasatospora sp. NPDC052896 TaxID=3364061 RepID=UPI0037CB77DE
MGISIAGRHMKLFDAAERNGTLEWGDLQTLVDRRVRDCSLARGSAEILKEGYEKVFSELVSRAGGASRLNRLQFVEAMRDVTSDGSGMNAFESLARNVFDAVDRNENGQVRKDEFVRFVRDTTPGTSEDQALCLFTQLDTDGKGVIDHQEAISSVREFLTSLNPKSIAGGVFVYLGVD